MTDSPRKRILLIDDDVALASLFRGVLSAAGYEVVTAGDAMAALSIFQNGSFDLVICDGQIPIADGPTTIRSLRKLSKNLPIIAISGGGGSILTQMADAGATTTLTKPVNYANLIALVQHLTSSKQ